MTSHEKEKDALVYWTKLIDNRFEMAIEDLKLAKDAKKGAVAVKMHYIAQIVPSVVSALRFVARDLSKEIEVPSFDPNPALRLFEETVDIMLLNVEAWVYEKKQEWEKLEEKRMATELLNGDVNDTPNRTIIAK